jgi:ABC-type uncharacterized transport system substrate-binding protein
MARTIRAAGNSRRLWRRLQGISRESPGKSEPGCKPVIRLVAREPRAAAIADGGPVSSESRYWGPQGRRWFPTSIAARGRGDGLRRRDFIILLGGAAAASPLAAQPRPAERMRRIGVLMGYPEGDPQAQANITALLQGLQNLGWIEGRDVQIDYRWAGGDPDKARTFARELIAMMPDLMVSSTNQVTRILQQETPTIPIVFAFVGDPVGSGFAASLARPGKNLTGFANFENSIGGKWLELVKEIAPRAKRVGFVFNPDAAPNVGFFHAAEAAAPSLEIKLAALAVRDATDIEQDIAAFASEPDSGLIVAPHPRRRGDRITAVFAGFMSPLAQSSPGEAVC